MKPIAIFYHGLFVLGDLPEILPAAFDIIPKQMEMLTESGLLYEASEFHVGINGGPESVSFVKSLIPGKAQVKYHGIQCRNECRTMRMIEEWLPGHDDWYVLYAHSKGATHPTGHDLSTRWRHCMMNHLVSNWKNCVANLDAGYDSVGCHWMTGAETPPGQSIWAGNFWWAKSNFLKTLPSIMERDRLKVSGIDSINSRYESEVWIGNGPTLPRVKDYHPGGFGKCP